MSARVSQNERVLAVLADGQEHEMRDIHASAGFMRLNSRVSELRSRGYVIECRREGGDYFYRLVASSQAESSSSRGADPSVSFGTGGVDGSASVDAGEHNSAPAIPRVLEPALTGEASGVGNEPDAGADQLSLLVEAA